ncbi:MAG: FG-GAP repeat protein [Verrucomicrobiales bacterium]|nr:FG-GAP repeat protein [Verrucomicrobiales bacterium]
MPSSNTPPPLAFWDFDTDAGDGGVGSPRLIPHTAAHEFSTDTPSGQGRSLRVAPTYPDPSQPGGLLPARLASFADPDGQLALVGDATLAAWAKPLVSTDRWSGGEALLRYGAEGAGGYLLYLDPTRRLAFKAYDVAHTFPRVVSDVAFPDDGRWHHVAAVHEHGRGVTFYLDGIARDFKPYAGGFKLALDRKLQLGEEAYNSGDPNPFDGLLDDVLISPAALAPADFSRQKPDAIEFPAEGAGRTGLVLSGGPGSPIGGQTVRGVGDVNGDGYEDVLIGAFADAQAYLVFGRSDIVPEGLDLGALDGDNGVRLKAPAGSELSNCVSAGDFNRDGLGDLLLSTYGGFYLLFGRSAGQWRTIAPSGTYDLANLASSADSTPADVRFRDDQFHGNHNALAAVGDMDGDGYDDFAVVAGDRVFLVFGGADWPSGGSPRLEDFSRAKLLFRHQTGFSIGGLAAGAGDVNGDGRADLLIGDPGVHRVWLLLGQDRVNGNISGAPFDEVTAVQQDQTTGRRRGYVFTHSDPTATGFGDRIEGIGDVNGDGFDDFLIGVPGPEPGAQVRNPGRVHLVFGRRSWGGAVDLATPGDSLVFTNTALTQPGLPIAPAGDENGDGLADLLFGSGGGYGFLRWGDSAWQGGRAVVLPGQSPSAEGYALARQGAHAAGPLSLWTAGDFNGDGISDLVLGEAEARRWAREGEVGQGAAYVWYGKGGAPTATARIHTVPRASQSTPVAAIVPLRGVGKPPGAALPLGSTRAAIGFQGGSAGGQASLEIVTLRRYAPPPPTTLSGAVKVGKVHWWIHTEDRRGFNGSELVLAYVRSELEELDLSKADVWHTPDREPTEDSHWSPMGAKHDASRRRFTVRRGHTPAAAHAQFNGCYAIFSADLVFFLGQEIPRHGAIEEQELPPTGPEVTPADATYWDAAARKLFAVKPASVVIEWKTTAEQHRGTTVGTLNWPPPERLQAHLLGAPAVSLSGYDIAELTATETGLDPATVSGEQRVFAPSNPGRSLLRLTKNGVGTALLPVDSRFWHDSPGPQVHAATIGRAVPDGDLVLTGAPPPYVLTARARYCEADGFYTAGVGGPIVPVNTALSDDRETRLVVAYYQATTQAVATVTGAEVPRTFWPGLAVEFEATWDTNLSTPPIVIASELGAGPIDTARYVSWDLYFQNDPNQPGFNPNDEHARVAQNRNGVLTLMPLRSDLGSNTVSLPYLLMTYASPASGVREVKVFPVVATNEAYPGFFRTNLAGQLVLPPRPVSDDRLCTNNFDQAAVLGVPEASRFLHRDRKGALWAKAGAHDGVTNSVADARFYYPVRDDYYFPAHYPAPTNDCVPLLDLFRGTPGTPIATTVTIAWPTDSPRLFIPESLVEPKRGLPALAVPPNPDGTPAQGGPCSVSIIYDQAAAQDPNRRIVTLVDPLKEHQVPMGKLPAEVLTEVFRGTLRFKQLPPHLYPRLTYERTDDNGGLLKLAGVFVSEPGNAEGSFFLPNVLSEAEVKLIQDLVPGNADWASAVTALNGVARNDFEFTTADRGSTLLALSSGLATGSGWVTLALQDHPEPACGADLPVSLEVFRVEGAYRGEVATLLPHDVFDERITFKHKADFAGDPDQWHFEWRLQAVGEEGPPAPVTPGDSTIGWHPVHSGKGAVTYTIAGASPFTLGDNRVIVRFRPLTAATKALLATSVNTDGWSDWTEPKLGEGWVRRVLDGINPYEQRFRDLADPARRLNTTVSMLAQAGKRWEGNIPLNSESVDSYGLIEVYETVYRRARALSIDAEVAYQPANNALLLAASRLSDLYMLLGNEAYADAADPTLAILEFTQDQYVSQAPALHAFQGLVQAGDLLLEELVLLRGRDTTAEPAITRPPFYNRFPWNFSAELGRVAYMANYDIRDAEGQLDGEITSADAQFYYPQGHGDAWGHYLSALKYYYRIAAHPHFTWIPRSELDEINGVDVRVDYQEEQKFLRAAAAKARTGAEIVNLTYRDRYTENPGRQWQGYQDQDRERAWGVADWSMRAGQGAYLDWVLGNALLPEAAARDPVESVRPVDRGTQPDFGEISAAYERIQTEVDHADRGLNPLGLERNTMPFDISTVADGDQTHFEQIYERAVKALSTAVTTFYYAAVNTQRLRRQSDDLASFQSETRAQERDYQSRLIELFGQPYREDIGPPNGAYPAGYTGPDYLHYDYFDPSPLLGTTPNPSDLTFQQRTITVPYNANPFSFDADGMLNVRVGTNGLIQTTTQSVSYQLNDAFGLVKPTGWTTRGAVGELQNLRSTLVQTWGAYRTRLTEYNNLLAEIEDRADLLAAQFNLTADKIQMIQSRNREMIRLNAAIATSRITALALNTVGRDIHEAIAASADGLPKVVGLSNDPSFGARLALRLAGKTASAIYVALANLAEGAALSMEAARDTVELRTELNLAQLEGTYALHEALTELQTLLRNEAVLRYDLLTQVEGLNQQLANYHAGVARGVRLLDEFKRFRFETSAAVAQARYKDMAYRVFRSDALQKYRAQFDLAARYVYLAARAYDYETAFLPDDGRGAGATFLERIVRSRDLGNLRDNGDGVWYPYPGGGGDSGLADAMAHMNLNWTLTLRGQLGFNNPQPDRARFSLRYDLFQILPHQASAPSPASEAAWRERLSAPGIRQANVLTLDAFRRYCIPFSPLDTNGEPALVIPFSTTISAGQNLFGHPLVENQDQFDSTKFANKIRSVKVLLEGLAEAGLSSQPTVYLVPIGTDVLRSPSDPNNRAIREFFVLDQALPVPFALSYRRGEAIPSALTAPGWIPSINGLTSTKGEIRRYGALKAYDASTGGDALSSTRLVGRSVWNTQWLLIIPGRTLLGNATEGIERFIHGPMVPATGERSGRGVTDIQLEFETYAFSAQ